MKKWIWAVALAVITAVLGLGTLAFADTYDLKYKPPGDTYTKVDDGEISFKGYISVDGKDYQDFPERDGLTIEVDRKKTTDINQHLVFYGLRKDQSYIAEMSIRSFQVYYGMPYHAPFITKLLLIHDGLVEVINPDDGAVIETYQMNMQDNSVDITYRDVEVYGWQTYSVDGLLGIKPDDDFLSYPSIDWKCELAGFGDWFNTSNELNVIDLGSAVLSIVTGQYGKTLFQASSNAAAEIYIPIILEDNQEVSSVQDWSDPLFGVTDYLYTNLDALKDIPEGTKFECTAQIIDITDGANHVEATQVGEYTWGGGFFGKEFGYVGGVLFEEYHEGWPQYFKPKLDHIYVMTQKAVSKEELYIDGKWQKLEFEHSDLEDKAQMFIIKRAYMKDDTYLRTAAEVDGVVGRENEAIALEMNQPFVYKDLKDHIEYKVQAPGIEYKLRGKLIDKQTQEVVATNEFKFTPTTKVGTITNEFNKVKLECNHEYYFVEELVSVDSFMQNFVGISGGSLYREYDHITHDDPKDKAQTIKTYGGYISTRVDLDGLEGSDDELRFLSITTDSVVKTITDEVSYGELYPGSSYTITGEVYDKSDRKVVAQNKVNFTPEKDSGSITMTFEDVTLEVDHSYVVFETIESNDGYYGPIIHKDLDDLAQSFKVENVTYIHTAAEVDGIIGEKYNEVFIEINKPFAYKDLKDHIEYKVQIPGSEYIVRGKLIDKQTQEVIATNEFRFTPTSKKGRITNEFKNVKLESCHQYYFAEELISVEPLVVHDEQDGTQKEEFDHIVHDDSWDLAQSIETYGTYIATKADVDGLVGSEDELRILKIESTSVIKTVTDTIWYQDLYKGLLYKVTGELYDITADEVVATNKVEFRPDSYDRGSEDMTFEDVELQAGHTYVVFETLESIDAHEKLVIEHKDIDDLAQSFKVVNIAVPKLPSTGSFLHLALQAGGLTAICLAVLLKVASEKIEP